jgi:hypothetical protein
MDTTTYASYGVLRAMIARDAPFILTPEPEFTFLDLSYINEYCCLCG